MFVLYLLNLPFLLDFGWKPHLQVWIWLIAYHLRPWILTPHTLVYLVSLLIMILCISLGAFALFTYVSLNVRNLQFKQFSVIFLGYSNLHKVFVCYNAATNMIHISIKKKKIWKSIFSFHLMPIMFLPLFHFLPLIMFLE